MAAQKSSRLNWLNISILLWFILGLALVFPALFSPFFFDSPGSTGNPFVWVLFGCVVSAPVICILSAAATWILKTKLKYLAYLVSFFPLVPLSLMVVVLLGMSLFTPQHEGSTVQVQVPPIEVGRCGNHNFDGGDGLATTGCGLFSIGRVVTGTTQKTSQAHNWEFEIMGSYPIPISVKNDGKTCPQMVIFNSKGEMVEAFTQENGRKCAGGGLVETQIFTFKQHGPGNETYFLRITTPGTPGSYWLSID